MTIQRIPMQRPLALEMTMEEARSLKWLLERCQGVLLDSRRDGELREVERRVMERDLLLIRSKLQGV